MASLDPPFFKQPIDFVGSRYHIGRGVAPVQPVFSHKEAFYMDVHTGWTAPIVHARSIKFSSALGDSSLTGPSVERYAVARALCKPTG